LRAEQGTNGRHRHDAGNEKAKHIDPFLYVEAYHTPHDMLPC
jgi:hypothetical protein